MLATFTLPLALFNFLPVIFTAIGLSFIVRWLHQCQPTHTPLAIFAVLLIVAGGLAKASWKLIATLSTESILWLSNALFPLIGPGFFLLAVLSFACWYQQRSGKTLVYPWLWAVLVIAAVFILAAVRTWGLEIPRGWFIPIMSLTTVGNLGLSIVLILMALRLRARSLAALFALNIFMVFALQPLALIEPKTLMLHWSEQILTTMGTLCFTVAAYGLSRYATRPGVLGRKESPAGY